MSKDFEFISESISSQKEANQLIEKLIAAGQADAVFSPPVESGEYMVITAAESRIGMGFGFGWGGGSEASEEGDESSGQPGYGAGGGGGGGGASMARPVAIIEIGPNGARVEPIIDPTKIALAALSMLITVFAMGARLRKAAKV
jgi:uncharacterized spore protein YtfJ